MLDDKYLSNLWEETIVGLVNNDKLWDDVCFVGIGDKRMSKEDFKKYAKEINYDAGYGLNEISLELKLYGSGFVMIREEYDGAEWWRFINTEPPEKYETTNDKYELFDARSRDDRREEDES